MEQVFVLKEGLAYLDGAFLWIDLVCIDKLALKTLKVDGLELQILLELVCLMIWIACCYLLMVTHQDDVVRRLKNRVRALELHLGAESGGSDLFKYLNLVFEHDLHFVVINGQVVLLVEEEDELTNLEDTGVILVFVSEQLHNLELADWLRHDFIHLEKLKL
jgi:hypothetical protein